MIEGARLLPFIQEAERRDSLNIPPCGKCMQSQSAQTRQTWGCAYEPPPNENVRRLVQIPAPSGCKQRGATADEPAFPSVCPGYTTRLPEVIEIARARLHWSKGAITAFCNGQPRSALLVGIEILEGASNEAQQWAIDNPVKKAGA